MRPSRRLVSLSFAIALLAVLAAAPFAALGSAGGGAKPQRPSLALASGVRATAASTRTLAMRRLAAEGWPTGSPTDWRVQNPKPAASSLLSVSFPDTQTGFAVGGGRVLKTTDGGTTWNALDSAAGYDLSIVRFVDANHGWAGGVDGTLLRTVDSGTTWAECAAGVSDPISGISFVSTSTGYVVAADNVVIKTTNGGATWTPLAKTVGHLPEKVCFVNATTGWITGDLDKVLKTTDGGATWTVESPAGATVVGSLMDVFFRTTSEGWACGYDGIMHTSDGGAHWTTQRAGTGAVDYAQVVFTDALHGWCAATELSLPSAIYVLRTEDGGATWTPIALPGSFFGAAADGIAFVDADHGWAVGETGGPGCLLQATSDGGKTWASQIHGWQNDLSDVSAISSRTAIAVGASGTALYTSDAGTTWAQGDAHTTETLYALASQGASSTWAVGENGTIRYTTDGGATWATQDSHTSQWLGDVWFIDATHGWASGGAGTLLSTTDGGTTWSQVASAPAGDLWAVRFVDTQTGWVIAGGTNRLYKTVNGGSSWTQQPMDLGGGLGPNSVAFTDANHGWAVGDNGSIRVTSDGGATWTPQQSRTSWSLMAVRAIDASHAVALTSGSDILRTDDGGASWWFEVSPGFNLADLDFSGTSDGWAVGAGGIIAHTTNGGGSAPAPSTLSGTIRSTATHKPVAGASVALDSYAPVTTDANGHYTISGIMPGFYGMYPVGLVISAPGYLNNTLNWLTFDPGSAQTLNFELTVATKASLYAVGTKKGRIAVQGVISPKHVVTASLRFEKLTSKGYVKARVVSVKVPSNGRFSYASAIAKGTYRVRMTVPGGKGYSAVTSAWIADKVK